MKRLLATLLVFLLASQGTGALVGGMDNSASRFASKQAVADMSHMPHMHHMQHDASAELGAGDKSASHSCCAGNCVDCMASCIVVALASFAKLCEQRSDMHFRERRENLVSQSPQTLLRPPIA